MLWFVDLSAARSSNGFGANPISFSEIRAWSELTGIRPTPFEVDCLRDLDVVFLKTMAKAKNG